MIDLLNRLDLTARIRTLGVLALILAAVTWWVDLQGLVSACPYCRTERTMIGLLGVLMVFPHYRYFTLFLALVFGLFGVDVAAAQVFMHIKNTSFTLMYTGMAISALCIMVGQVLLLIDRGRRVEQCSVGSSPPQ